MRSSGNTDTPSCTKWQPALTGEVCSFFYSLVSVTSPPPLSLSLTERQYVKAREHFLYAEQPQEFGNMLVELAMTFGYSGEADLFIAQAVLQ